MENLKKIRLNKYSLLESEKEKKHLNNFLEIKHLSVSAVNTFQRNQVAFQRRYQYKIYDDRVSVSCIVGRIYHDILIEFFIQYKNTKTKMLSDEMLQNAHRALMECSELQYKFSINKTFEQQQAEALKKINSLILNFHYESDIYLKEIKEILFIEWTFKEYITLLGYDISLPFKFIPDIVFINKNDELCILDHKSKASFTRPEDINMQYGNQCITYVKGINIYFAKIIQNNFIEDHFGLKELIKKYPKILKGVQKFYLFENKSSKNRDNGPQIQRVPISTKIVNILYEAMLLDPIQEILKAVQDPNYNYILNTVDNFCDQEELLEFWLKTKLNDFSDFNNISEKTRKILSNRKQFVKNLNITGIPEKIQKMLKEQKINKMKLTLKDMKTIEEKIQFTLMSFGYRAKIFKIIRGYSYDIYLLDTGPGQKVDDLNKYKLDIAKAIGVDDIRICEGLTVYEGASYKAFEVNKDERIILKYDEKIDKGYGNRIPIGRDNLDNTIYWDLDNTDTPHLLGGGTTGSGKSVFIKSLIKHFKGEITILDPKREFDEYKRPSIEVIQDAKYICEKMTEFVYIMNNLYKNKQKVNHLIIFDEFNAAMLEAATINMATSLQNDNLQLVQKARSCGLHLAEFSQRVSAKVMVGDAKANFATRICFKMPTARDSQVNFGYNGAESLNGRGDALFIQPGFSKPLRIQTFFTE